MRSTPLPEWDATLAAGGKIELDQPTRWQLATAVLCLAVMGAGVVAMVRFDLLLAGGAVAGLFAVFLVGLTRDILRPAPDVLLSEIGLTTRVRGVRTTIPWASVHGATVVRLGSVPQVLLTVDAAAVGRRGRRARLQLPPFLGVRARDLARWVDGRARGR